MHTKYYNNVMEKKLTKKEAGREALKAIAAFIECDWRDLEAALIKAVKEVK